MFCNSRWESIGSTCRPSVIHAVSTRTRINKDVLISNGEHRQRILASLSVAQKLSWAASRSTTRPEDMAYSLLGLLNLNMPLLYGEGGQKAFRRLQKELISTTDDESIFAWYWPSMGSPKSLNSGGSSPFHDRRQCSGILADNVAAFRQSKDIVKLPKHHPAYEVRCPPYTITNKGLQLHARYTVEQEAYYLETFEAWTSRSLDLEKGLTSLDMVTVLLNCCDLSSFFGQDLNLRPEDIGPYRCRLMLRHINASEDEQVRVNANICQTYDNTGKAGPDEHFDLSIAL